MKKSYVRPALFRHGAIEQITLAMNGSFADFNGQMQMMQMMDMMDMMDMMGR